MRDLQDDSDELTFVSEMDEDTPSKSFVKRAKVKQHPDSQNEDSSSGPSDGEIYRIPFDAINNDAYSGVQFQTIEELENENVTKSRSTDGVVSPASARSNGIVQIWLRKYLFIFIKPAQTNIKFVFAVAQFFNLFSPKCQ